jgi:hypothetical protein
MSAATIPAGATKALGYKKFEIGKFTFERDEYFAKISYPKGYHTMRIEDFLRALMRDVAWGFFYGTVNFDNVLGTVNHYGTVDLFLGSRNEGYIASGQDYMETFESKDLHQAFRDLLDNWTNEGFDPFAAPDETGTATGAKHGSNTKAITRKRVVAKRMVGLPGDEGYRTDENGFPLNRQFRDVPADEPELHPEPGFEGQVHAFNLFNYVARSDVTWNPSVVSAVKDSLLCPTTEEFMLPVFHGNDRVEWFIQATDEISWDIEDGKTGRPRAKVIMKAGDVAAMPADIRHKGYSPKRSILLVWENGDPSLPERYARGEFKPYPAEF